ncbi:MAG: hypothetical protein ACU83N_16855, partial [Gammaproteobacteria bacterium]
GRDGWSLRVVSTRFPGPSGRSVFRRFPARSLAMVLILAKSAQQETARAFRLARFAVYSFRLRPGFQPRFRGRTAALTDPYGRSAS